MLVPTIMASGCSSPDCSRQSSAQAKLDFSTVLIRRLSIAGMFSYDGVMSPPFFPSGSSAPEKPGFLKVGWKEISEEAAMNIYFILLKTRLLQLPPKPKE